MSENSIPIIQELGFDPFRDESDFSILEFVSDELVDMVDVYHKKTTIKFNKSPTTTASDILTSNIRTYVNSKLLVPISSQEVDSNTPAGTPTYEFKTVRNSENS